MEQAKHFNVPILVGIIPLKSAGMARFMNRNVAGVNVPDSLIEEMANATDRLAKSIEISARLIRGMKDLCQGVHLMPVGWEKHVPAILDAASM
jgi:methylenetetrahydrofolate reductase (NADPH)